MIPQVYKYILGPLEAIKMRQSSLKLGNSPVFIVGAPRSGTTLLYQLLTQAWYFAYFSEYAANIPWAPVMITEKSLDQFDSDNEGFNSNYGHPEGIFAPGEAGRFWNRWFPTEKNHGYNYVDQHFLSTVQIRVIYQTIAHLEQLIGAPFINKNVKNCVRIRALNHIFPHALFIYIERDLKENAASLLQMRKKKVGDVNKWLGVMPKEINFLKQLDGYEQIIAQLHFLKKNITEDLKALNCSYLHVQYEELCNEPNMIIKQLAEFFDANKLTIKPKGTDFSKFSVRGTFSALPEEEQRKIIKAIEKYDK
ncbi:MAG: sulfotransferase [Salinivirgaceae bacterium]